MNEYWDEPEKRRNNRWSKGKKETLRLAEDKSKQDFELRQKGRIDLINVVKKLG